MGRDNMDGFFQATPEPEDPFANDPAGGLNFIMLNRIYDVLMAQLRVADSATAQDLLAAHMSGLLLGPTPWMNGQFVTDILNQDESTGENTEDN